MGRLKFMARLRRLYRLRIHCWGGLGSQIFAWAVVEELLLKGFSREIELILHTSGVTERTSELERLSGFVTITQIHDYLRKGTRESDMNFLNQINKIVLISLQKAIKKLMELTGIISSSNSRLRIFPWTMQLRGHYSKRRIDTQVVRAVLIRFQNNDLLAQPLSQKKEGLAIHYRLGDLLTLEGKNFVSASSIHNVLDSFFPTSQFSIDVYSDSPNEAVSALSQLDANRVFNLCSSSPWSTISELLNYRNFLATNSKIGMWVAIFRSLDDYAGITLITQMLESDIRKILDLEKLGQKIHFF